MNDGQELIRVIVTIGFRMVNCHRKVFEWLYNHGTPMIVDNDPSWLTTMGDQAGLMVASGDGC